MTFLWAILIIVGVLYFLNWYGKEGQKNEVYESVPNETTKRLSKERKSNSNGVFDFQSEYIQSIDIGESTQFKGRRTLKNPNFKFQDKNVYLSEGIKRVRLFEGEKELLTFNAENWLINAYCQGLHCKITAVNFERIRGFDERTFTFTIIHLTVEFIRE